MDSASSLARFIRHSEPVLTVNLGRIVADGWTSAGTQNSSRSIGASVSASPCVIAEPHCQPIEQLRVGRFPPMCPNRWVSTMPEPK